MPRALVASLTPTPNPVDSAAVQADIEVLLTPVPPPVHRSERWALVSVLCLAGLLVTVTAIPAAFTIDESNYLASLVALRQGRLTMPGTDGLPATTELIWFDPVDRWRTVESTPVAPLAPPLWALLAFPFSFLGWRGLVGLNTLAFLATAALVFAWVRRLTSKREAAWLALAAFALGSPQLEYAQGVWPHELAMLLVFGAGYLAFLVREGRGPWLAVAAGALAGLAGGVRHQNLFAVGCIGLGLVLFVPRERRYGAALAFGAGAAVPVLASCSINWLRIGHFHPAWKGIVNYLEFKTDAVGGGPEWLEALHTLWAKVVDFSTHPALPGGLGRWHAYLHKEEQTGAFIVLGGAVKKAWFQSSPWHGLSLMALSLAWLGRRKTMVPEGDGLRELRAISIVIVPVLGLFAVAGFARFDGLCYNQRYFQELIPFVAVALGLVWGDVPRARWPLLGGALAGLGLAALAFLTFVDYPLGLDLAMKAPLGLAAALVLLWPFRSSPRVVRAMASLLGASIAWGLGAHVFDDVRATNRLRELHLGQARELAAVLPERSGVIVWLIPKSAIGPLILGRDLVIVDASADDGEATPAVVGEMLERGRPVFLVLMAKRIPDVFLEKMRRSYSLRKVDAGMSEVFDVFELLEKAPIVGNEIG